MTTHQIQPYRSCWMTNDEFPDPVVIENWVNERWKLAEGWAFKRTENGVYHLPKEVSVDANWANEH